MNPVIPAKAGIHDVPPCWIPACAGMTAQKARFSTDRAHPSELTLHARFDDPAGTLARVPGVMLWSAW
jgi:hypothetical protein